MKMLFDLFRLTKEWRHLLEFLALYCLAWNWFEYLLG